MTLGYLIKGFGEIYYLVGNIDIEVIKESKGQDNIISLETYNPRIDDSLT